MEISQLLLSFSLLMLIALALYPLAEKYLLPYPTLLVMAGYIGSEILISQGMDTGLRWDSFRDLVYYILLPVLIYEAAFLLSGEKLLRNLFPILLLSIPFMLASTLITAILIYFGIHHPSGFPLIAAMMTGALLSATDPSTIAPLLNRLHASERLVSLLEGESLFNSVMAIILVSLILEFVIAGGGSLTFSSSFILFVRMFTGGLLLGIAVGAIGWGLSLLIRQTVLRGVISLVTSYSGYLMAEIWLDVSGLLAVLVAGLILNGFAQKSGKESQQFLQQLWEYKAYIAKVLLFILLGVSIRFSLLTDQWIAILIGIVAVLAARAVIVFLGLWLFSHRKKPEAFTTTNKKIIFWGNIKGAATIALVLSLPDTLPYSTTIQGIAYGVILFSLFVQAPTLRFLLPPPSNPQRKNP